MAFQLTKGDYYKGSDGKYYIFNAGNRTFYPVNWTPPESYEGTEVDKDTKKPIAESTTSDEAELKQTNSGNLGGNYTNYARYPSNNSQVISKKTDYVLFQFADYTPPFKNSGDRLPSGLGEYNQSIDSLKPIDIPVPGGTVSGIILPMPQDLSTEQKQNWNGKKFTRLGASAIRTAGGDFSALGRNADDGGISAALAALKTSALNRIPGVGGNLSINDITGSTRGVVLNPNAELLYDSPDLREIGMVFKMVPQTADEAKQIKMICDAFRTASLPKYGAGTEQNTTGIGTDDKPIASGASNFIRVPNLCKFTFMTGSSSNENIAQYKACAITGVQVNYTPDGTYATYHDGAPVATEITLKFVETKLIFSSEIQSGF
jgi:hypothetical protein